MGRARRLIKDDPLSDKELGGAWAGVAAKFTPKQPLKSRGEPETGTLMLGTPEFKEMLLTSLYTVTMAWKFCPPPGTYYKAVLMEDVGPLGNDHFIMSAGYTFDLGGAHTTTEGQQMNLSMPMTLT